MRRCGRNAEGMIGGRRRLLWLALVVLVACDIPVQHAVGVTRRDSAGIEIVTNDSTTVRLAAVEEFRIGSVAGEAAYRFDRIADVKLRPDGSILVADRGDATLRVFDAEGRFLFQMGREGEGPGEFVRLGTVWFLADTVVAGSSGGGPARLTFFGPDGTLLRILTLTTTRASDVFVATSDGMRVWSTLVPEGEFGAGEVVQYQTRARAFDPVTGETGPELLRLPSGKGMSLRQGGREFAVPPLFEPQGIVAPAENDLVFATTGEGYEVRILDHNGVPRHLVRREYEPNPVTDEHGERFEAAVRDIAGPGDFDYYVLSLPGVSEIPAIDALQPAAGGGFWIRRADLVTDPMAEMIRQRFSILLERTGRSDYDVEQVDTWEGFAPDGTYLGTIEFRDRFTPHLWGEGWVMGVFRDELDVEYVVKYRVEEEIPMG